MLRDEKQNDAAIVLLKKRARRARADVCLPIPLMAVSNDAANERFNLLDANCFIIGMLAERDVYVRKGPLFA